MREKDCEAICTTHTMGCEYLQKICVETESPEGKNRCAPDCKDKWNTKDCANCREAMTPAKPKPITIELLPAIEQAISKPKPIVPAPKKKPLVPAKKQKKFI